MNEQHVQLPIKDIDNLEPKDKLIFLAIKRWDRNGFATVPMSVLSKQSGASAPTIRTIIKKLVDQKYIEIVPVKKGQTNTYKILDYDKFEKFNYEFLDNTDLTFQEKAFMAATKQYLFKEGGVGKTTYSNQELSQLIHLSPSSIQRVNKSLEQKQVLLTIKTQMRDLETGCFKQERIYDLEKMGIVPILQAHNEAIIQNIERLDNHEQALQYLYEKIQSLEKDNKILRESMLEKQSTVESVYID